MCEVTCLYIVLATYCLSLATGAEHRDALEGEVSVI